MDSTTSVRVRGLRKSYGETVAVNGGYGLRGMRSRILQVGGSLLVRARPGAGTSLSVEVPV